MIDKTAIQRELKSVGYELFIGALSILSLVNLVAMIFLQQETNLQTVLFIINVVMTPIFFGDFLYRFFTAEHKGHYFWQGFGWADLLSSVPIAQLKILRLFRIWRVIRLLIAFGARNLWHEFVTNRAGNALLSVFFLVLCVIEFGSFAVLIAEQHAPDANITNAADAIWWVYVTITTVGYGDYYPVTINGRLVGILVMTSGVGLFGTLSGFLANKFLAPKPATAGPNVEQAPTVTETLATGASATGASATGAATIGIEAPTPLAPAANGNSKAVLVELRNLLAMQEQATAELRRRIDELEAAL